MAERMHADQLDTNAELVRELVRARRPQWGDLAIERVASTGTDNALYRLGNAMVARLPLRPSSAKTLEREGRWLPIVAPHVPLSVPVPLHLGEPTATFPWVWSVYRWFAGEDGVVARFDRRRAAVDLARFLHALRTINPSGGPEPGDANFGRGVPLADRDDYTRRAIDRARGLVDADAVTAAWDTAIRAPAWGGGPQWLHGDVAAGNLLFRDGRLSAVIDWGGTAVGDPACDLSVAWELFDASSREVFRTEMDADDATWQRGRGWALSTAIVALPYYQHTNPFMAAQARHKIDLVLSEQRPEPGVQVAPGRCRETTSGPRRARQGATTAHPQRIFRRRLGAVHTLSGSAGMASSAAWTTGMGTTTNSYRYKAPIRGRQSPMSSP